MGTTKEYLQKLYRQSAQQTQNDLGTKGAFVILASKMGFAAIGISLLVLLGLLHNDNPIYKTVLIIFTSDIVGFVAMWFISPFVSIWNMPKTAELNEEKLRDRLEEFEPSKITLESHHYNFPEPNKKAGILITNKTDENLDIVIELTGMKVFEHDDFCEPHETYHEIDKDGCYFEVPRIDRKSHQVIYLAQAEDDKVTFLTKKPSSMFYEFFYKRQPWEPQRDFFRLWYIIEVTVKGKTDKDSFDINYAVSMMLRWYKPHLMRGSSHVEIEEILYVPKE